MNRQSLPDDGHPERPRGNGRQKCARCERRSIAGFARGQGLCPYHWAEAAFGRAWAARCYTPVVYLICALFGATTADAQTFRAASEPNPPVCLGRCPAGPPGAPGIPGRPGAPGPRGPAGPAWTPPVCAPLPALDLPLTAPSYIEPGDCAAYVLGYLGTTAYLVDLRGLRYQALPAPLSGHAMTATSSSRVDPWLILASDATGLWLVRVTPTAAWAPLP